MKHSNFQAYPLPQKIPEFWRLKLQHLSLGAISVDIEVQFQ
uniref:Uncharacterized protein n=1 Tax=Arundo donax TaxID=35708 RepID=A0A0A9B1H2_ARUDO